MRVGLPPDVRYIRDQEEGGRMWHDARYIEGEPQELIAWASHVLACAISEYAINEKAKK